MADNYLEKRYEEVFGSRANSKSCKKAKSPSLNSLLLKNRSHRIYDQSYQVSLEQLRSLIDCCTKIPSARNQQVLRYKLVIEQPELVSSKIRLGGHESTEGISPKAYIVICSVVPESRYVDIDLGIAAQSILLKAAEMDLRGICIGAFDKEAIKEALSIPYEPILIIGIGKGLEAIQLTHINQGDSQSYYEKGGVHFVPKLTIEDLII